jgi:hypothetical protein
MLLLEALYSRLCTRGSAMECAAICDVLELIDQHYSTKTNQAKAMLKSIVSILTTICSIAFAKSLVAKRRK